MWSSTTNTSDIMQKKFQNFPTTRSYQSSLSRSLMNHSDSRCRIEVSKGDQSLLLLTSSDGKNLKFFAQIFAKFPNLPMSDDWFFAPTGVWPCSTATIVSRRSTGWVRPSSWKSRPPIWPSPSSSSSWLPPASDPHPPWRSGSSTTHGSWSYSSWICR